jgi:non-homologous end joining protein Ku
MRRALRLVAACAATVGPLAAGGCGGGQNQQIEQEAEKLVSAARTTSMLAREWAGGRVTDVYARQMARLVGEQMEREASRPVWQQADPQIRQTALEGAATVRRLAERLETSVAEGNVGGAASLSAESADLARSLGELTGDGGEGGS